MIQKKYIILIVIGIFFLIAGFYQIFLKGKKSEFDLIEVKKGNIVQEIFESGQIQKGERINLSLIYGIDFIKMNKNF